MNLAFLNTTNALVAMKSNLNTPHNVWYSMRITQQYTRKNNIIISRVPTIQKENTKQILQNYARAMGMQLDEYDINTSHNLPNSTNMKSPNIIVKPTRRTIKNSLTEASKNKKST